MSKFIVLDPKLMLGNKDLHNIVKCLNVLVNKHGYDLVFHSDTSKDQQLGVLRQLQASSNEYRLTFPKVTAMVVFDSGKYSHEATAPELKMDHESRVVIVGYGQEPGNKSGLRTAVSSLTGLQGENELYQRNLHYFFDVDDDVVETAIEEEYSAVKVQRDGSDLKVTLDRILKECNKRHSEAFNTPCSLSRLFDSKPTWTIQLLGEEHEKSNQKSSSGDCTIL
jgi:hypothetical protein